MARPISRDPSLEGSPIAAQSRPSGGSASTVDHQASHAPVATQAAATQAVASSSASTDRAYTIVGLKDWRPIRDGRVKDILESNYPYSPRIRTPRKIVLRNLTVLFRLLIWHHEVRGSKKYYDEVLRGWGLPVVELYGHGARIKVGTLWTTVIDARQRYIDDHHARGVNLLDRQPIPTSASAAERRLLELIDKVMDDIKDRGLQPTPTAGALGRLFTRSECWLNACKECPTRLVAEFPHLEGGLEKIYADAPIRVPANSMLFSVSAKHTAC